MDRKLKPRYFYYSILANGILLPTTVLLLWLWLTKQCYPCFENGTPLVKVDTIYPTDTRPKLVSNNKPLSHVSFPRSSIPVNSAINSFVKPELLCSACDSVVMYSDTVEQPGNFKAVIVDTLLNNNIIGRSVWWVNLKPLIRETITLPPKEKPRLYIGASIKIPGARGVNWGLGPSALATIPKAGAIGYSYDVLGNCHSLTFMALIKLKR